MSNFEKEDDSWDEGYDSGYDVGRREALEELLALLGPTERGGVSDAIKRKLDTCLDVEVVEDLKNLRSTRTYTVYSK